VQLTVRNGARRNMTVRNLNAVEAAVHACLPAGGAECNATVTLAGAMEGLQILEVVADGEQVTRHKAAANLGRALGTAERKVPAVARWDRGHLPLGQARQRGLARRQRRLICSDSRRAGFFGGWISSGCVVACAGSGLRRPLRIRPPRQTHTRMHARAHTLTHSSKHTRRDKHARTRTLAHAHARRRARTYSTRTCTRTCTHTNKQKNKKTTQMHTHARTHAHTHTSCPPHALLNREAACSGC
jgi:hypothetical protein